MSDTPITDADAFDVCSWTSNHVPNVNGVCVYAETSRNLERQLAEVTAQRDTLAEAVKWALGEGEEGFRERCVNEGQYWWRNELRERASLAAVKQSNS